MVLNTWIRDVSFFLSAPAGGGFFMESLHGKTVMKYLIVKPKLFITNNMGRHFLVYKERK